MHSETATFVSKQNVSRLVTENFEALPFSALKLLSIERLNGCLGMKRLFSGFSFYLGSVKIDWKMKWSVLASTFALIL